MTRPKRLLVLDIGNTSVTAGLYHNGQVTHVRRVAETRDRNLAASDKLRQLKNRYDFIDCIMCSVVPRLNTSWSKAVRAWTGKKPILVTNKTPMPIGITFPKPDSIGADRLANATCLAVSHSNPHERYHFVEDILSGEQPAFPFVEQLTNGTVVWIGAVEIGKPRSGIHKDPVHF